MDLIPSKVVQQKLLEIAENVLGTKKLSSHVERGTVKGDNYIGIVYRARFHVDCNNNKDKTCAEDNCRKLNVIIKVPPENKIRRDKFFARPTFLRESLVYDEILPLFMQFQESKGIIPSENGFHEIAPSYGTITEEYHEAIFLKDLADDGFEMYNRHNYIPVDHAHLVMKILGKLHAISYAMKDQCPEKFEKYKQLEDIFKMRENEEELSGYMTLMKDRAVAALDPEKHQTQLNAINKMFEKENLMQMSIRITNGHLEEPYAIISHGDCWNNNILYRYENGKLADARLIDWQICRYSTPVCDLMYFLFLATSSEMRKKHYQSFLDTYYDSVSSFITRLGSNPDELFPRKAFDEQLKKNGKFGFLMGCMLIPILTTHSEDIPDLDEMSEKLANKDIDPSAFRSERSDGAYKERMTGIVLDMFDLGYFG